MRISTGTGKSRSGATFLFPLGSRSIYILTFLCIFLILIGPLWLHLVQNGVLGNPPLLLSNTQEYWPKCLLFDPISYGHMIEEGSRAWCQGRVLKRGWKQRYKSFKLPNLVFKSSFGLMNGAEDVEGGMD